MAARKWTVAALAAGVLICAGAVAGALRWRAWQTNLPPPLSPAQGQAGALAAMAQGGSLIRAVQLPPAAMRYPRWRMELRRPFLYRRAHVRTWLVAARLTGILPGTPASPRGLPPSTSADVWVIGVEGYCREMGPPYLGPGQPPPIPPDALCWTDLVYHGDTGRMWWGMSGGSPVR